MERTAIQSGRRSAVIQNIQKRRDARRPPKAAINCLNPKRYGAWCATLQKEIGEFCVYVFRSIVPPLLF